MNSTHCHQIFLLFKFLANDILFADEDRCSDPTESDKKTSLPQLVTSPYFMITALVVSLTILLAITQIVKSYRKTEQFQTAVRQTLDTDSPTSESDKHEPPPYKAVIRLGRSYQYCDIWNIATCNDLYVTMIVPSIIVEFYFFKMEHKIGRKT